MDHTSKVYICGLKTLWLLQFRNSHVEAVLAGGSMLWQLSHIKLLYICSLFQAVRTCFMRGFLDYSEVDLILVSLSWWILKSF